MPKSGAPIGNQHARSRERCLVSEYVQKFPDASHASLARLLMREHGHAFTSLEACRSMIRTVRGKNGKHNRKEGDKSLYENRARPSSPEPKLPPSIKRLEPWAAVPIEKPGDWLIVSDVHAPFHDEWAVELALDEADRRKVVGFILDGDILDFYRVSHHRKDVRKVDLWEEIEAGRQFLEYICHRFPKAEKYYKWGNHEERWENWMVDRAPELMDIPEFKLAKLLNFEKLGIREVKDKRHIMLGKLTVLHGHEFRRGMTAPVSPARGLWMRAKTHALMGDCHRTSHHAETVPSTRHVWSCFTIGCLCQTDVDYDPYNNWNQGFAIVHIDKAGAFDVTNYRIIDGRLRT